MIETVGIASRRDLEKHGKVFARVIKYLNKRGMKIYLEKRVADILKVKKYNELILGKTHVDLMIVMGGDGTILRVISKMKQIDTKFFGINMGHLGFLSEIPPVHIEKTLDLVCTDKCTGDKRPMLKAELYRDGKKIKTVHALNEVAIVQGTLSRLISLRTKIDGKKLATFKGDGLLVATPTGSTAYSLSAGGPIVHPSIEAFILTPINPHSFNQKPLVIPNTKKIQVTFSGRFRILSGRLGAQPHG